MTQHRSAPDRFPSTTTATARLANGLTVVACERPFAPVFGLAVVYRVGSRSESRGRSGFAHLFEHLMFEGTETLPRGVFDRLCESSGGLGNGQTRPDTTVYHVTAPSSALSRFLFLEADRMRDLLLSEEALANQRDVVKEEIRVNVQNDPYGLFEYGELPGVLFDKWENAHDGYGDFADLDAATLEDVRAFHSTFYGPNNAVVAVAGDVAASEVFDLADRYFGSIPKGQDPRRPDLDEPRRTSPHRAVMTAPLAKTPALAIGFRTPPREHADVWPLYVLGELLHDGRSSRLYRGLVEGRELATEVWGGFNPIQGGVLYNGTSIFLSKIGYRRGIEHERVLNAFFEEVEAILRNGVPEDELSRVRTKMLASRLAMIESSGELSIELAHEAAYEKEAEGAFGLEEKLAGVCGDDLARAAGWLVEEVSAVIVKQPSGD